MPTRAHRQLQLSSALTKTSQPVFILDNLKTGTLISLSQLCDDDCIELSTKYGVKIIKQEQVIINGKLEYNGPWSITLKLAPPPLQANGILCLDQTNQSLASYHHASLGSPSTSTLLRDISLGHLLIFPCLTTNIISKHLPKSLATALGHEDQEAKTYNPHDNYPSTPNLLILIYPLQ